MNWIINNPIDALQLLWGIAIKPCVVVCVAISIVWLVAAKIFKSKRRLVRRLCLSAMTISVIMVGTVRVYHFAYPDLNTDQEHENYD